jgi:hypothetical protein
MMLMEELYTILFTTKDGTKLMGVKTRSAQKLSPV